MRYEGGMKKEIQHVVLKKYVGESKENKEGNRVVKECKSSCNLKCVPCSVIQVGSMLSSLRLNKIMAEVG